MSASFNGPLVLMGMMGSGKSTIGALLAQHLGWRFVDLDKEIEQACHNPIAQIFDTHGEDYFRTVEHQMLEKVLGGKTPLVVALGGGTPLLASNQEILRRHRVVWLDADWGILWERVKNTERPLARDREKFERLWQERRPVYQGLAARRVDADSDTPNDVVHKIVAWAFP